MTTSPGFAFELCGEQLIARQDGSLWWPDAKLLVVADLHLEKGTWYGSRTAQALPPYDTRATLAALRRAIGATGPATVVCLGDSFHDENAAERIGVEDASTLACLVDAVDDWVWIVGNHDPRPPRQWGGSISHELAFGRIVLRHEASRVPLVDVAGEVSGHYHPVAALTVRGRGLRRRCFATDRKRLVLPSYGAYTGGLNVLDPAIASLFGRDYDVLALGTSSIHRLPNTALRRDPRAFMA